MNTVLKAERSSDMLLALQENGMATKLKRRSSPLERADRVIAELERMGWDIVRKEEKA